MKTQLTILVLLLLLPFAGMAQQEDAKSRFYAGIVAEEIEGNLGKAESIYKELLKKYPDDRLLSAKCLYHLGLLYEKQESKKAMDPYVSLLEKYPDQADLADLARNRISKLNDANTFIDPRDGHKYKWVKIGNQIWMAENLAYMPHVNPPMKQEDGIWVYDYAVEGEYNVAAAKATENHQKYGCLYDWPTAMDLDPIFLEKDWGGDPNKHQGICPPGWRMPSDQDWMEMERFLGMPDSLVATEYHRAGWTTVVGGKRIELPPVGKYLKSTEYWNSDGEGSNSSGFNIIPAGERWGNIISSQSFSGLGYFAGFWTSTEGDSITNYEYGYDNDAFYRQFRGKESQYASKNEIERMTNPKTVGFSVRCIKSKNRNPSETIVDFKKLEKSVDYPAIIDENTECNWNQCFGNEGHRGYTLEIVPENFPQEVLSVRTIKKRWTQPVGGQGGVFYHMSDTTIGFIKDNESTLFWESNEKLSPDLVYSNAVLVCKQGNTILALDTNKKEVKWEWTPSEKEKLMTGYLSTDGEYLVFGSREGILFSIDLHSGNLNWSFKATSEIITCPTIVNGKVYFTTFRQQTTDYRNRLSYLYSLDAVTGKELWKHEFEGRIFSSPTVANELVFMGAGDNYLYAIDANTGQRRWRFYADGAIWDCPSVGNGKVYFQSHAGYFFAVDISSGDEIWRYKFESLHGGYYHSLVSKNAVVFGTMESGLIAVSQETGNLLWKYPTESRLTYNPIMVNDQILFRAGEEIIIIE